MTVYEEAPSTASQEIRIDDPDNKSSFNDVGASTKQWIQNKTTNLQKQLTIRI